MTTYERNEGGLMPVQPTRNRSKPQLISLIHQSYIFVKIALRLCNGLFN
jgi:hypothetical protein